jgi:PAS domain S-box-containing protein
MNERESEPAKRSWFGLLEAFLLFIGFLFLVDTALQYVISSSQASKASEEVLSQTAVAIEQKIDGMRESTEFLLLQSKDFAERKIVDPSDFRSANPFFMEYIKAHPHITSVNYGDSAGNGYLILWTEGLWKNRIKKGSEQGTVQWLLTDEQGKVLSREQRKDDYDPRVRPWYTDAAGSPGIHWSRPYVFRTTHDVGVTASTAIDSGSAPTVAIGVDIMLKDLSRFLSTLKRGKGDLSISLVSSEGEILASSEVEKFAGRLQGNSGKLPRAAEGGFPDLTDALQAFGNAGSDFLSFSSSGRSYYALRRPFRFSRDLGIIMILTIPRESLLSFFGSTNWIRGILFLILVAVSGVFFAIRYIAPLRKLTRAVQTFGSSAYEPPSLPGRNDEVGVLVSDFRRMAEDLTARQEELAAAAKALGRGAEEWRETFDSMTDFVSVHDKEYRIVKVNRAMSAFFGVESGDLIGKKCHEAYKASPVFCDGCSMSKPSGMETPSKVEIENSAGVPLLVSTCPIRGERGEVTGFVHVARDLSEQKKLESQLIMSRKMEAVGKLAGGIAHDFNNFLTAIIGYSEFLDARFPEGDPSKRDIGEIRKAADHAASLTHQLLAYSRKQILQPRVIGINSVVSEVDRILRRLIGEDIDLVTKLDAALWNVKADPGQISQVVMNLAINARDAMPGGGKLTIETGNVFPGEEYWQGPEFVEPGPYVMLAVSDTGTGMSEETIARMFDPFFTTKATGKGTGLGLSTVYGIVKQSKGYIWAYSEPGHGSTFKVYLPKTEEREDAVAETASPAVDLRGDETVLVVDDDGGILKLTSEYLARSGYRVLSARDGEDALRVAEGHDAEIALLVTDVIMPKLGGKDLYRRLAERRPGIKVLYMSGYTATAIVHHGVLEEGAAFLQKPFDLPSLARKVREVLDAR